MKVRNEMFGFLFKKKRLNDIGHKLYSSIIAQSRLTIFYSDLAVEDNLDGRFDVLALHMSLILDKLDLHGKEANVADLKRILQEIMFDNLDLTLREIGVGDLGVGKKIKVMAEAFFGRMMVYQDLFRLGDTDKMSKTLHRNLYREKDVSPDILNYMSIYVFNEHKNVTGQSIDDIMSGVINFTEPEGLTNV